MNVLSTFNTADIYRLSLLVGVCVALTYRDRHGIIPGGLIVPGSLVVLLLLSPIWCVTVLGLSAGVFWIYQRWFQRTNYKRRTPMYILAFLSLSISSAVALMYQHWGWLEFSLDSQVGSILPGVIAFNLGKQGVGKVCRAIAICTPIALAGVLSIAGFLELSGLLSPLQVTVPSNVALQLHYPYIHYSLALSVGYLIYRHQDIRSGGYMVAPVVAITMLQPFAAIHFITGCAFVYVVTQLYCEWTLTVGLRRYAIVLCLSTLYLWASELILQVIDPSLITFQGSSYLLNIAMLSYVNDAILYQKKPVFRCMTLMLCISAIGIMMIDTFNYLLA
ncbi:MAG: poly-gamma-glutamate biosynthesis protein PgsC/CapC [Cyanobacteria bacterium J06642_2]